MSGVCEACWAELEPWRGPVCSRCGMPLATLESPGEAANRCPACGEGQLALGSARSFGLYRDSLRAIILLLKFQRRERLGTKLGSLLGPVFVSLTDSRVIGSALLVPVPLHSSRLRERGYNQAELLCRGLLRALPSAGLRLEQSALRKIRATPPQAGLSMAARRENVRGAFAVAAPERVRGQTIILVDDVMTTGATLSSCATELRRAGASDVLGLTLARATPQFPDAADMVTA